MRSKALHKKIVPNLRPSGLSLVATAAESSSLAAAATVSFRLAAAVGPVLLQSTMQQMASMAVAEGEDEDEEKPEAETHAERELAPSHTPACCMSCTSKSPDLCITDKNHIVGLSKFFPCTRSNNDDISLVQGPS